MAAPRKTAIRGTIARGESAKPRRDREPLPAPEPVMHPARPRSVVDHGLERRAALVRLFGGGGLSSDLCDADPYLLRAAKHHGEPAGDRLLADGVAGLLSGHGKAAEPTNDEPPK